MKENRSDPVIGPAGRLSLALLAFILFLSASWKIRDPDIWLYLQTGQWSVSQFRFPLFDIYSYTRPGAPWLNHSWLSGVLLHFLFRGLGVGGLYLFRYLLTAGTFILVFLTARRKIGWPVAVWLTLFSILAVSPRFLVRPELFTFFFIALLVYLLEKGSRDLSWWPIPLVFFFWANLHGGFVLGLGLLGLYWLGDGADLIRPAPEPRKYRARGWRRLTLLLLCSLAAALLNPAGHRVFLYYLRIRPALEFIYAWQPLSAAGWRSWGLAQFLFPGLALLTALALVRDRDRVRIAHLLISLAFGYLGLRAGRNIFLFALIAPALIAANLSSARKILPTRLTPPALLLIAGAVLVFPRLERDPFRKDIHREFGWGVSAISYPSGIAEFIERHRIPGRIFHSFGVGSYLAGSLWPEKQVYIDGRITVYGLPFLLHYNGILVDPELFPAEAEHWKITMALFDYLNPSNLALLKWLERSPAWELARFDSNSALYLKADTPGLPALREAGLEESLRAEGLQPRENAVRGGFLLEIGRADQALPRLERAREAYPRSASLRLKIARARLIREEWEEAETACREALRLGGEKVPLLTILAHLHLINNRPEEAAATARAALHRDPGQWAGYEILGDACRAGGDEPGARRAYREGYGLNPSPELAAKIADSYFLEGGYRTAADWYERIGPATSIYPRARVYLAGCLAAAGEYGRAEEIYRSAAAFAEYSQICSFNLSRISSRKGREAEAARWAEKVTDPRLREKLRRGDPRPSLPELPVPSEP